MKKVLLLGCIVVLSLFSVGCGKVIELTDEENYLIAEYAAELLLKYDNNSDSKYYDGLDEMSSSTEVITEELTEELTEETVAENVTEELLPEIGPDDNDSTTTDNSDDLTEEGSDYDPEHGSNVSEIVDVSGITADAGIDFDIAAFAGIDTVSVKYQYYMLVDRYPSYDQDGVYIEIEAPTGYKLLVLKFAIENKTNELQDVDLYSKNLDYSIIINDSKSAKQMLTILIDDLYTYQSALEASMREETVLLFQISDTVAQSIEDLKLKVNNGDDAKVIQLQ